jgi:hypothetical protein
MSWCRGWWAWSAVLPLALVAPGCEDGSSKTGDEETVVDADRDGSPAGEDCDDTDPGVAPGAEELCDGLDNDCDGAVDEDVGEVWYTDEDGDGFGSEVGAETACAAPPGKVPNADDCDDSNGAVYPGGIEVCDGIDTDCDGIPDPTSCRPLATSDAVIAGDQDGGGFGDALLALGDLDGDGTGTLLIGAPGHDGALIGSGTVYAFSGALSGTLGPSAAQAQAEGDAVDAGVGASLARLPDLDGDGYDEVMLSAWGDPTGGGGAGAVHVVGAEAFVTGTVDLAEALFKVHGSQPGDSAGLGVAALGDQDGDGRAELLVGAPNAEDLDGRTSAGLVAVVSGATEGTVSLSTAAARVFGVAEGDYIGEVVDGPGDMDGDGIPDLVLGSQYDDRAGTDAGAIFALLGPLTGMLTTDDADAVLVGEAAGDAAGSAVRGAGDVDGDGLVDVIVGATDNDAGGESAGAAYVVSGSPLGWTSLVEVEARLIGRNPGDKAGNAVARLDDVNGDRHPDVLVGAYIDDSAALNAGSAYMVYGPLTGTLFLTEADGGFIGEAEGDLAGWTVASAGDYDSDGRTDVLVGARRSDRGATDGGTVYLLYGAGL